MTVRPAQPDDEPRIVALIAEFRASLAELRGRPAAPAPAAENELAEYRRKGYPIFVAEVSDAGIVGYLVCRVDGNVVWAESLYVRPECRRRGAGSALYAEAERLAESLGGHTVYNWVHPTNDAIIGFLRKRGYSVLNLVELRRPRPGERPAGSLPVGKHEFDY